MLQRTEVNNVINDLRNLGATDSVLNHLESFFETTSIHKILLPYETLCRDLAARQAKVLLPIQWEGSEIRVPLNRYRPFLLSLIHIVRNAVDHGIELPEERKAAGKNPSAQIRFSCHVDRHGQLSIEITDDGRGINVTAVEVKAKRLGLLAPEQSLSDSRLVHVLFSDGFSTKEAATQISGRGVGLSAVQEELEQLGGTIHLKNRPNQGTSFQFLLPFWAKPVEKTKTSSAA